MNPYNIDQSKVKVAGPLASLKVLYEGMPQTSGCEQCKSINGDNFNWCCLTQYPSLYYAEFLYLWQEIQEKWTKEHKKQLLLRAIRCYLDNSVTKGCVCYDEGCQVYNNRPFACRIYGVIPQKNWEERWKQLKKRQGKQFQAKPQCNLVKSETPITSEMEDKWFVHSRQCEERIGIAPNIIKQHDLAGGSYRAMHDHILLEMLGEDHLVTLSDVRMTNPSKDDIDLTIRMIENVIDVKTKTKTKTKTRTI